MNGDGKVLPPPSIGLQDVAYGAATIIPTPISRNITIQNTKKIAIQARRALAQ
jgi:hypothetical protein